MNELRQLLRRMKGCETSLDGFVFNPKSNHYSKSGLTDAYRSLNDAISQLEAYIDENK